MDTDIKVSSYAIWGYGRIPGCWGLGVKDRIETGQRTEMLVCVSGGGGYVCDYEKNQASEPINHGF